MAELREASGELTIELLMREMKVNDDQLNSRVEESDLPELAACFDNTEDYVEKLQLSPGQQTDVNEVKAKVLLNRTQTGMKLALKYWRNRNPVEATFKALLLILLSLTKGDIAIQVCKYLSCKHDLNSENDAMVNQLKPTLVESEKPYILTLERHFPNLGVGNLSEAQLKVMGAKLYLESSELVCKFNKLCTSLYFSLKRNTESKEDLVACLMSLDTFEPVFSKSANQPVFGDQKAKLFAAKSLHEVWYIISHYHSYFNYYIVEHIIEYLGTDTDRQNLSSYKESFAQYAKRRVYECPAEFGYENPENCNIIVKLDKSYDNCDLHQLELLRIKLCEILRLSSHGVLRLCRVEQGCYELTLQAPSFIQETAFPLSPEQEAALEELKILWLLCGDYEFSSQQQDDDHNNCKEHGGEEDDDDHSDGASQATTLLEHVQVLQPTKKSPGSTSDSGVGKSAFDTETKSLMTEFTEDVFDLDGQLSENTNNRPQLLDAVPSALNVAAYNGDLVKVKYCLEVLNCDPLQFNANGNTTIHVAADGGQFKLFKYLRAHLEENKTSFTCMLTSTNSSSLHIASLNGHLPLIKYLVEEIKLDPLLTDSKSRTPLHNACRNGNIEIVRYLIDQARQHHYTIDVVFSDRTKLGNSVLHFAAASGNCQLLHYLISNFNLDPNTPGQLGATPLLVAAQEGHCHIVEFLSSGSSDMYCSLHKTHQNALHIAAGRGHLTVVKFLIDKRGFNPNDKDSGGCSPLHLAAQCGSISTVECLIENYKCDKLCCTKKRRTPLHYAASAGHLNIVKYFVEKAKVEPLLLGIGFITPLHLAVKTGRARIVSYYLDTLKCCIDSSNRLGERLLLTAVTCGYYTITRDLLSHLKWTRNTSGFRQTQLLVKAATKGHLEILKYFIVKCKWKVHHSNELSLLYWAIMYGRLNIVRFLVTELSYDPHKNPDLYTSKQKPLHMACIYGHIDIVKYLVEECGVDCSPQERKGYTSLQYAAVHGNCDIVQYLIEECNNVDPLYGTDGDGTALHWAVSGDQLNVVEYLTLKRNISPNVINKEGATPLHIACSLGMEELVAFLLDLPECNTLVRDCKNKSPLMLAVQYSHLKVVKLMIGAKNHNLLVRDKNSDGENILHFAAAGANFEIIKYISSVMESSSINVFSSNVNGVTPLHIACLERYLPAADYLSPKGKTKYAKLVDAEKRSPLHYAVKGGSLPIVKMLVKEKSHDPLCTDDKGNTPFHTATYLNHCEIVQWFFSKLGIDPNTRTCDRIGSTCFHIACSVGIEEIVEYLLSLPNCDKLCSNSVSLTGLHLAVHENHCNIVKILLKAGLYDTPDQNANDDTPLHVAIRLKHFQMAKLLILAHRKKGISLLYPNKQGSTLLHYACFQGNLAIVKYLLVKVKKDFTLLTDRDFGFNPLHRAV